MPIKKKTVKKFTTFQEQEQLLRDRKLVVVNSQDVVSFLERNSYYHLTPYARNFSKNGIDEFKENTCFENVKDLYHFDSRLRLIVFKIVEDIELAFRTQIAYVHSKKYNPLGYLDLENFKVFQDERMKGKLENFHEKLLLKINNSKNQIILYHVNNYEGVPIWVAFEVLSFSQLSKFFSNMKTAEQKEVIALFYIKSGINNRFICNYLQCMTEVRNIAAHFSRLYNKSLPFSVNSSPKCSVLTDSNSKTLFALVYNTYYFAEPDFYNVIILEFENLFNEFAGTDISKIGFPQDWKNILLRSDGIDMKDINAELEVFVK